MRRAALFTLSLSLFSAAACNELFGINGGSPANGGAATTTSGAGGTTSTTTSSGGTTGGTGGTTGGTTGATGGTTMTTATAGTGGAPACGTGDAPATSWAKHPTGNYEEDGQALTVTAAGDVYMAGYYEYSDFVVESLTPLPYPDDADGPGEKENVFVAKYSANGVPLKSVGFVGQDTQSVTSMAVAPNGDVVVGGYMIGTMTVGNTTLTADEQYTPVADDGFVVRLDKDLNPLWAKQLGGKSMDEVRAVATDSQGNVVILGVGVYTGSEYDAAPAQLPVDFGCPAQGQTLNKTEDRMFLTKLDPDGNCLWGKAYVLDLRYYGFYGHPEGLTMTVDKDDNVIVAGGFGGTANFGGGYLLNAFDNKDIFLLSTDPSGATRWAENYGGLDYQVVNSVVTDQAGDIWAGGHWGLSITLTPALSYTDPNNDASGNPKGYVAKFTVDPTGANPPTPELFHVFNDAGRMDVRSAAIGPDGDAVFGGVLVSADGSTGIDFGDGNKTLPAPKNANGDYDYDAYVVRYCKDGALRWSRRYQTSAAEIIEAVGVDGQGRTYATGEFGGVYNFEGPQSLTPLNYDAFLMRTAAP